MRLRADISERWEQRLYRWVRWVSNRQAPIDVLVEDFVIDVSDIATLMHRLEASRTTRHIYHALYVWIEGSGTRATQARRLGIGVRTLYDRVEAGKALLEYMHKHRSRKHGQNAKTASSSARLKG